MHPLDSMHACLNVDEIVRLIACELVASGGRGTAVALACCRKSLEDPVLDALWVKQHRFFQLLKSFPGDVWNEGGCTVSTPMTCFFLFLLNGSIRKSFRRLPTTIEWARFRKYARRMRELREHYALDVLPPMEVLPVLKFRTVDEPLLPSLKTLHLSSVPRPFVQFIPFLLSPGVTSIFLAFAPDCPQAIVASVVSSFPTRCPDLQMISLDFLPTNPMITAVPEWFSPPIGTLSKNSMSNPH